MRYVTRHCSCNLELYYLWLPLVLCFILVVILNDDDYDLQAWFVAVFIEWAEGFECLLLIGSFGIVQAYVCAHDW